MTDVAVVGAGGYLGSKIALHLAEGGQSVTAWCRDAQPWQAVQRPSTLGVREADVTCDESVRAIAAEDAHTVVYCVSLDHTESEADAGRALAVNVSPVWQLLEALSNRKRRGLFVYLSTAQVYGRAPPDMRESSVVCPANHYGLTHLMCEDIARRYHGADLGTVSLRLSNGYGAPLLAGCNCWQLVVNDLCRQAVQSGQLTLASDGTPQRNFIHICDIARAVETLARGRHEQCMARVYNLGGPDTLSIYELAQLIAAKYYERSGLRVPIILPRGVEPPVIDARNRPEFSSQRMARLGFAAEVTLAGGIAGVLEYLDKYQEP